MQQKMPVVRQLHWISLIPQLVAIAALTLPIYAVIPPLGLFRASAIALPFTSARNPHPSSTVSTIGFGRFFIARQNTWIYWTNHFVSVTRYHRAMRTPPRVDPPNGGTPAERLDMAFRKVLTVSKQALIREEAKAKHRREKKRTGCPQRAAAGSR